MAADPRYDVPVLEKATCLKFNIQHHEYQKRLFEDPRNLASKQYDPIDGSYGYPQRKWKGCRLEDSFLG